jgi:aspartate carbamoyltransferase catalytic subunit
MRSPHLLSVKDLSREEILEVLDTARELSRITDGAIKKLPTLRGRSAYLPKSLIFRQKVLA